MYYIIIGDIEFVYDEDWKQEAVIRRRRVTAIEPTSEEANKTAEFLQELFSGADYLIPQEFDGRIYNYTDQPIQLAEQIAVKPQEKIEWAEYRKVWEEHHLT